MTRARTYAQLAVVAVALLVGSVADAAPKSLSVLGLEVTGSNVTQQATDAAVDLTKELRNRAQLPNAAEFNLVGGPQKELLDQKLLFNCQAETPPCLVKIANDVHAEVLLFGSFELSGSQVSVTLKLFDASANGGAGKMLKVLKNQKVDIAQLQGSGTGTQTFARKLYADITGESANVQLTLKITNSDSGTVRVNDKAAQPYTSGQVTVTVPEGKTHVVVEPNEKTVGRDDENIQATGQEMTRDIKLPTLAPVNPPDNGNGNGNTTGNGSAANPPCTTPGCQEQNHEYGGTISDGRPRGGWRTATIVGAIATAATAGTLTYGIVKSYNLGGGPFTFGSSCSQLPNGMFTGTNAAACNSGKNDVLLTEGAWVGLAVLGTFTAIALYEGYIRHDSPQSTERSDHQVENRRRKRRERFVVTPLVGPNGGGATVQLNW